MKTFLKLFYFTLISVILFSCEDILEKDITNKTVNSTSPIEGSIVQSNVVNFQWDALEGANKYRVQLYDNNQIIILDSLVSKTKLTFPLNSGNYKWKVRGENLGYRSMFSALVSFSLIQSSNLATQQVILSSPSNSFYSNSNSINLSWQNINAATSCTIEIVNVSNGSAVVFQQSGITNTFLNLTNSVLSTDGEYLWKVKAINATSETAFSSRTIFIDRTSPNQPQLITPLNNSTQINNLPLTFNWSIATDSGAIQSTLRYLVEFSNTNTFSNIFQSSNVNTNSLQQTFSAAGDYYWRVKTLDAAGNASGYSSIYKITIN